MPQLQNVPQPPAGFAFNQGQIIQQGNAGNQRFFADHITAQSQTRRDMRMVQMVGRAYRYVIQRVIVMSFQTASVVVKTFKLGKELTLWR